MQKLIEGANFQMSYVVESEAPSFYQHASFKKGVAEQLIETENKKRNLEIRMIEMEEEMSGHAT